MHGEGGNFEILQRQRASSGGCWRLQRCRIFLIHAPMRRYLPSVCLLMCERERETHQTHLSNRRCEFCTGNVLSLALMWYSKLVGLFIRGVCVCVCVCHFPGRESVMQELQRREERERKSSNLSLSVLRPNRIRGLMYDTTTTKRSPLSTRP